MYSKINTFTKGVIDILPLMIPVVPFGIIFGAIGIELGFGPYLTYATSIILGVASFIPGGIGVSEGTLIGLLSLQGLTISSAVSLTIFIRIFTLWYSVLIGFVALKLSGALSLNSN